MKGSITGSCGHEFKDDEKGNELTIKDYDHEEKCLCYVYVCDKCVVGYEQDNVVLHNTKEQNDYLYGEGTVENIIEVMKDRGYSVSSYTASHSIYFFGKAVGEISINATVNIKEKDSTVELTYHDGLKMLMYIATGHFAFDHEKFERHEKILLHYANICNLNNPFNIGL